MGALSPTQVLLYHPNIIGYVRIAFVILSYFFADSNWKASVTFYMVAFAGDAVDGHVARMFNQSSRFGAVLDMVTDRCSTAGLLMVLSRLYGAGTLSHMFLLLMFIDLFSHWMHVESVRGHHKAADTLAGRNPVIRLFYGCYPFFAYCCVGTEMLYVLLFVLYHQPEASLALGWGGFGFSVSIEMVCYWWCLPACLCKQVVNIAQLCAAAHSLASLGVESQDGDSRGAIEGKAK